MTRIVRLRERLPSLWRPEEGDGGLVSGLLDAVAGVMDHASRDASDVLQSRWWAYADRAEYHPFFVLSRALDPSLDPEDFPYVHDLARIAALLPLSPREEPAAYRDSVETFRLRIRRMVDLYRSGLGTVGAVRRVVEAELPLVPDVPLERRDRPFLVEELTPGPQALDAAPYGAPGSIDLLGPLMRFDVVSRGVEARPPTAYVHGVAATAGVTDATVDPVLELYRMGDDLVRVGLAYEGTVADGQTLRVRPSYASWLGGGAGLRVASASPQADTPADPTAPGPWTAVEDGPTDRVTALAWTEDHVLWAATRSGDVGALHRFDGQAWTEALAGLPAIHDLRAVPGGLVAATDDGLRDVPLHPASGDPFTADPVAGTEGRSVRSVAGDGAGGLWMGADTGLLHRDGAGVVTETVLLDAEDTPLEVNAVAANDGRGLLLGTNLGLLQYRPDSGIWFWFGGEAFTEQVEQWHPVGADAEPADRPGEDTVFLPPVRSVFRGPDAALWIGTEEGPARYVAARPPTPSGRALVTDLVFQTTLEAFPDLTTGAVHAITADARGVVWIATETGLHRFDGRDWWQHRDADGWVQMGRADFLYPAGREPRPRGAWRWDRGAGRWQRFDESRSAWSDVTDPARGTDEAPVTALAWTDGAVADLGTWDGSAFTPTGPAPDGSLRMRYKPSEDRIVDGGIPAVPRVPPGASVWRYLSLESGAADPGRATPWWTREGRRMPPVSEGFELDEAPPPGRFDRAAPEPPVDWDNSVYAYLPSARVRLEWAARQPRRVLVRLLGMDGLEPLDPAILDRVWAGILRVRPAGVRAALAVDETLVRQNHGDA